MVHTNSLKSAIYGGLAAKLAGVPVVWHVRDRISEDYLPSPVVRGIRVAATRVPDAIIANSYSTLDTLRLPGNRLGANAVSEPTAMPTAVVPSAIVWPSLITQRETEPARRPFTIGIVGRLAPWKGQHVFLDGFERAFRNDDARAIIIGGNLFGEDAYETELRSQAINLGTGDRVEFTGHQDDVEAQYARIDVLVHASTIPEPFGQVIIEGMARGLPVIASNAGGPAEIITHDVDGLLFTPSNADALAELLRRLADEPDTRARLGNAGFLRASEFTPERAAAQVHAVYRSVLDEPAWWVESSAEDPLAITRSP